MKAGRTLLVIGAGASAEIGLPIGQELKKQIAKLLDFGYPSSSTRTGDSIVWEAISRAVRDFGIATAGEYQSAAWKIRDAMPQALSIDNYIDTHRGNEKIELCGKLAIVRSILEAERKSNIFIARETFPPRINFERTEKTWLNRFTQILTENCHIDDLANRLSSLTLIIFNYDRCVEHYLLYALQNYYSIDESTAGELVNQIEIIHPYGKVGGLPWQCGENSIEFGATPDPHTLLKLSSQIRTFTEGTDPESSQINTIMDRVVESDVLLFLGFSFLKLNMKILKPEDVSSKRGSQRYFATALGFSEHDRNSIKNELERLTSRSSTMQSGTAYVKGHKCFDLFNEYSRSLSIS